jgi:chemotaxis protein methyltransferase CheR
MTFDFQEQQLSNRDFNRLSQLIFEKSGINIGPAKRAMVESRLQKRMRALAIGSHREYCDYLFSDRGFRDELQEMIDVITTNKTDFFREPHHFEFLYGCGVGELIAAQAGSGKPSVRMWSAGCSTGEEPYSLAMIMQEYGENMEKVNHEILATDISTKVLRKACQGIYSLDRISHIPTAYKHKYFHKHSDPRKKIVRVAPDIRSMVTYRHFNLICGDMTELGRFQVIFCRNVIIYFDARTKRELLHRLRDRLVPGGFLFLGHSETFNGTEIRMEQVGSTIYRNSL